MLPLLTTTFEVAFEHPFVIRDSAGTFLRQRLSMRPGTNRVGKRSAKSLVTSVGPEVDLEDLSPIFPRAERCAFYGADYLDQLADKHISLVWRERDIVWIKCLAFEDKAVIRPINKGG